MTGRPNFVFIVTDQQTYAHVGYAGNDIVATPNIDSLAHQGSWFDNFYVASPSCMPNRATMMTGRMPALHGVRHNGIPLDWDSVTFVDVLRAAGYRTGLVGKSHLQNFLGERPGYERESFPENLAPPPQKLQEARKARHDESQYANELQNLWRGKPGHNVTLPYYGFDDVKLCTGHGDQVSGHYEDWLAAHFPDMADKRGPKAALSLSATGAPQTYKPALPEEAYPTRYVEEQTIAMLERWKNTASQTPFFLQCSFPDPHHPFTPPGRYWDMYDAQDIKLPRSFYASTHDQTPPLKHIHEHCIAGNKQVRGTSPFIADEAQAREIVAKTYGQITMIDDAVGAIASCLKRLDLMDDTVIVFTSDHGDWMGAHGLFLKGPLHYQNLIRVPFVWRDPSNEFRTGCIKALGGSLDLARTILARAGLQPANGMQGQNLLTFLKGGVQEDTASILIEQTAQFAYLGFDRIFSTWTLVTPKWRLSIWEGCTWGELYNLDNDPDELINLWDTPDNDNIRARLQLQLIHKAQNLTDKSPFPLDRA